MVIQHKLHAVFLCNRLYTINALGLLAGQPGALGCAPIHYVASVCFGQIDFETSLYAFDAC